MNKIIVRYDIAIQTDEVLVAAVHAYPCLYGKSNPGYKYKLRKENAWNAVGDAIGYDGG